MKAMGFPLALLLCACMTEPTNFRPIASGDASKLEAAKLQCRGEVERANLAAGKDDIRLFGLYSPAESTVYDGCMARLGFVGQRN